MLSSPLVTGHQVGAAVPWKSRSRTRYVSEPISGEQVALARVLTDEATFAYLADVFVVPQWRGRGIAKKLIRAVLSHPKLGEVGILLRTRDAHDLYRRFGFETSKDPESFMFLSAANRPLASAACATEPTSSADTQRLLDAIGGLDRRRGTALDRRPRQAGPDNFPADLDLPFPYSGLLDAVQLDRPLVVRHVRNLVERAEKIAAAGAVRAQVLNYLGHILVFRWPDAINSLIGLDPEVWRPAVPPFERTVDHNTGPLYLA